MFRTFGHTNSSVLDGGLPRWVAEGYMTESGPPAEVPKSVYPTPTLDESVIKSELLNLPYRYSHDCTISQCVGYEQMLANASNTDPSADIVLDARPRGRCVFHILSWNPPRRSLAHTHDHPRFLGIDREPRPGLPSGHMPNSFSLTFNLVLQRNTTPDTSTSYSTFLPPQSIRQAVIEAVGGDNAELIIKGEKPVTTTCGSGMTAGAVWLGLKLLGVEKIGFYDEVRSEHSSLFGTIECPPCILVHSRGRAMRRERTA
jgi:thiosulfate/3-mercaptopyruvate sulfurtransferase